MWQEQKKMAQHLLANYQPEEARREETKEDRSTHTEIGGEQKDEASQKDKSVISQQISQEQRWKIDRKIEQKVFAK